MIIGFLQQLKLLIFVMLLRSRATSGTIRCLGKEREALLKFKDELVDESGRLSSWENMKDCCKWTGIRCNNLTNNVIMLDLNGSASGLVLRGKISPSLLEIQHLEYLDLSFNDFNQTGIPQFIGSLKRLQYLDISSSNISGRIPHHLGNLSELQFLNLSNNLLSGQLPRCFADLPTLKFLNLANNNFSGKIPSLNIISSLHLANNSFTGEIPESLRNCTSLIFVDLSENKLSGKIPTWVGDTWTKLFFLSLRSNEFTGTIPANMCHLTLIQVLDLSLNKISGNIPKCLSNMTALTRKVNHTDRSLDVILGFEKAILTWKGRKFQCINTLRLMKFIDLSSNNLVGVIPTEITSLVTLLGLNLSRNNLSGVLPTKTGQLRSLDFLDMSRNHFDGTIPSSLSQLDQLGVLDLSYNNLVGKIPQSMHLQTFGLSSFDGNPGLCGRPLAKECPGDETAQDSKTFGMKNMEEEDTLLGEGYYISMALGFFIGLWGVCGTLFVKKSWRIVIFEFV